MALRMVLDLGDVETLTDQCLSDAFCDAARLIDDRQFRAHLAARSKPWALAVSQFFHDEHPRRSLFPDLVALDPDRSITVVDKHGESHPGFVLGARLAEHCRGRWRGCVVVGKQFRKQP